MATEQSLVTMNVSLPRPLKGYVDGQVSAGAYSSASEFIRQAIREKVERDHERTTGVTALASKLLEGLQSGKPIPFVEGHFESRKKALVRRAGGNQKQP